MSKKINTEDITIVVQGAIHPQFTKLCLESIAKHLPKSEVILSTWKSEEDKVEEMSRGGVRFNRLILNEDPGMSGYRVRFDIKMDKKIPDNTNRQIVSTINGLKAVKTKYAMKLRNDFVLTGTGFLKYFNKFKKRIKDPQLLLFDKRILIMGYTTEIGNIPFWINDLFSFGTTDDMIKLWDIKLMDDDCINYYFKHDFVNKENGILIDIGLPHRYFAEPYIFVNCVSKNIPNIFDIFRDYTDATDENRILSEKLIANNFVALETELLNVEPLKENLLIVKTFKFYYKWQKIYKKYCDKKYTIPLKYSNHIEAVGQKNIEKLNKYLKQFFQPIKNLFNFIGSIFLIFFYLLKLFFKFIKAIYDYK